MLRILQFIIALLLLIGLEVLRVYFIMPFPGSQRSESIDIAYFLHQNIVWFRWIGWLMIAYPVFYFFIYGNTRTKWLTGIVLGFYLYVFFLFNYRFLADKMFLQIKQKTFVEAKNNSVPANNLVLGISINGESKAYPIEIIGYHHQVRDTVGREPVMVTYCTVCRTGRVFSPQVEGRWETFRLVGMDHFNAMFEDSGTQTWWRQVNGEAIAGPLKGQTLKEIPAEQMSLRAWLELHPDSKILQPDTTYNEHYEGLKDFDEGTIQSGLEHRDSLSWKEKSWVVGVQLGTQARAYDWNELLTQHVINDTLSKTPIAIAVDGDSLSFYVWKRDTLEFSWDESRRMIRDKQTQSWWNARGVSIEGSLTGSRLQGIQSYQEFWHSWKTFRPHSTQYKASE
ncbi:MAG: DUF3179 domain-containing (seleno)protein [Bacteroidota bacterium]